MKPSENGIWGFRSGMHRIWDVLGSADMVCLVRAQSDSNQFWVSLVVHRFPVSDSDSQKSIFLFLDNLLTHQFSPFLVLSKWPKFEHSQGQNYVSQSTWRKRVQSVPWIASFLCSTTIPSSLDDLPQHTLASHNWQSECALYIYFRPWWSWGLRSSLSNARRQVRRRVQLCTIMTIPSGHHHPHRRG